MRKISIRIEEDLYQRLLTEYHEYGYRSLSAYISKLLEERVLVELKGSDEMASLIHKLKLLPAGDDAETEGRIELCQSYDSLMTEIMNLRSCVRCSTTSNDPDGSRENI